MQRYRELASLFLKLGFFGFGGPAVHIAMMRREVVQRRGWLTDREFLDLVAAVGLIPGPNSTELAIHIGYEKGGWRGLILAGLCFITPAVLLTGAIAMLYTRYGELPNVKPLLYGIGAVLPAIIVLAIIPMAKTTLVRRQLIAPSIAVFLGALWGIDDIYLMFGMGILAVLLRRSGLMTLVPVPLLAGLSNGGLFLKFLKIGSLLYGSGYVLFSFIDTELVATGWLTRQQLTDAIAVGQMTPGPVFSAATFVGYQIGGCWGAMAATLGIFLPSFLLVAALRPMMKLLRDNALFAAFLEAVSAASVAIIAAFCVPLTAQAAHDVQGVTVALVAFAVGLYWKNLNPIWLIVGGGVAGLLFW